MDLVQPCGNCSYPYATNIWIEGPGNIVAKIEIIIIVTAPITPVEVEGTSYIGRGVRYVIRIRFSETLCTTRCCSAKIDQARLNCFRDIEIQRRIDCGFLYVVVLR